MTSCFNMEEKKLAPLYGNSKTKRLCKYKGLTDYIL